MLEEGMTLTSIVQKMAAAEFAIKTSHEIISDAEILSVSLEGMILASQATYLIVARRLGTKLPTADVIIAQRFSSDAILIE